MKYIQVKKEKSQEKCSDKTFWNFLKQESGGARITKQKNENSPYISEIVVTLVWSLMKGRQPMVSEKNFSNIKKVSVNQISDARVKIREIIIECFSANWNLPIDTLVRNLAGSSGEKWVSMSRGIKTKSTFWHFRPYNFRMQETQAMILLSYKLLQITSCQFPPSWKNFCRWFCGKKDFEYREKLIQVLLFWYFWCITVLKEGELQILLWNVSRTGRPGLRTSWKKYSRLFSWKKFKAGKYLHFQPTRIPMQET